MIFEICFLNSGFFPLFYIVGSCVKTHVIDDTDPDLSFPTLNPAYMGFKLKHSVPAYSLASWLQNPLSSMETDTAKDKHLDSLSPPHKEIQAGGKAADQQGHELPPLCK